MRGINKLSKSTNIERCCFELLGLGCIIEIRRPNALRPRLTDRAQATKRFNRELNTIIARVSASQFFCAQFIYSHLTQCEKLSAETNCWLVIAAQHNGSGSAATHFTSPSLRREAMEEVVGIINSFQEITSMLLSAKRQDATAMLKELGEAKEQVRVLREQVASQEAALTAANSNHM